MSNDTLSATHVRNLQILKSYITKVDSTLNHLSSVIKGDLSALDKSLDKINGKKIAKIPKSKINSSLDSNLYSALLGNYTTGSQGNSRLSRGQIFADLAANISKAMKRDL